MNIGVIHTVGSPCRCADAIADGLKSLGHRPFIYDSEGIELTVGEIADTCSLVIDHSDTYRGKGSLRAMVRLLLEAHGVKLIGSGAKACFLCDDKAAARARLIDAGISVPPGVVMTGEDWETPSWLTPPIILKSVYSHMSRGIALADTIDDAKKISREMFAALQEPVLIESYIAGRELAVSVIEGNDGLQMLTPFEWLLAAEITYQTERFKAVEQKAGRDDCRAAELSEETKDILIHHARLSFQALGMRHYGRFDIRLSSGGTFYFLEANTTPSFEPAESFAFSAKWSGFSYEALLEHLIAYASTQYGIDNREKNEIIRVELPGGPVTLESSPGVHRLYDSSIELAKLLDVEPGERVLELGCGSGFLAVAAAKLGAREVVATDTDARALAATEKNARLNGVGDRIKVIAGLWYEPLRHRAGVQNRDNRFDVIITTPPQTPGPYDFGPRWGGLDGLLHFKHIISGTLSFLDPGQGRLWLLVISLVDIPLLMKLLKEQFAEVAIIHETERSFRAREYEAMAEGLFSYLLHRRASGKCDFREKGDGAYSFRTLYIRASKVRDI
ncbi:MAG: hypothetical protein C0399_08900 [Syntrophus sp. (in: bacteria)]|nr:hypothetical protein [Syntrophus sp. (in: bacteria)]